MPNSEVLKHRSLTRVVAEGRSLIDIRPYRCATRGHVLLLLVVLCLVGHTRDGDAASPSGRVVLKFSHNQQTITPPHKAAEMFKQAVEQRTNGYYDVQIVPAQQLGGLRDQVEQTILGAIEVTQQPSP